MVEARTESMEYLYHKEYGIVLKGSTSTSSPVVTAAATALSGCGGGWLRWEADVVLREYSGSSARLSFSSPQ